MTVTQEPSSSDHQEFPVNHSFKKSMILNKENIRASFYNGKNVQTQQFLASSHYSTFWCFVRNHPTNWPQISNNTPTDLPTIHPIFIQNHTVLLNKFPNTPPKINMSPQKGTILKGNYIFQPSIFMGQMWVFPGKFSIPSSSSSKSTIFVSLPGLLGTNTSDPVEPYNGCLIGILLSCLLPWKLICPLKIDGWKIPYWNGHFLGDMLVFRGANKKIPT